MAEAKVEQPVKRYRARAYDCIRADFENQTWTVKVAPGTPYEALLKPEFWLDVVASHPVTPHDRFTAIYQDNSIRGEFIVWDCGRNWGATVVEVGKYFGPDRAEEAPDIPAGFSIGWRGVGDKYVVSRDSDKAVISRGHKQRADAVIALIEHVKSLPR